MAIIHKTTKLVALKRLRPLVVLQLLALIRLLWKMPAEMSLMKTECLIRSSTGGFAITKRYVSIDKQFHMVAGFRVQYHRHFVE